MPWCDDCARFWTPASLDGRVCPTCGNELPGAAPRDDLGADGDHSDAVHPRAPWHFKLLVVALVLYLAFRVVQGVIWVGHHL